MDLSIVDALVKRLPRHPDQWNLPREADAEIVRLASVGRDLFLATAIDGVATGLLASDPYAAGWTMVQAALSDLAAVGATPLGVLTALAVPEATAVPAGLVEGIADALENSDVSALGGDTSRGTAFTLTACALGLITGWPVTRMGVRPGDELWVTGPLGAGNAVGLRRLFGASASAGAGRFLPRARLEEGAALRPLARAMTGTADGALAALGRLARLNGVGMRVEFDLENFVPVGVLAALSADGLPLWPLLAGPYGEYELLVALPPGAEASLRELVPRAVRLARATAEPEMVLALPDGRHVVYDELALAAAPKADERAYGRRLKAYGEALGLR